MGNNQLKINFEIPLSKSLMSKSIGAQATISFKRPAQLKKSMGTQVYQDHAHNLRLEEGDVLIGKSKAEDYGPYETKDFNARELAKTRMKLEELIASANGVNVNLQGNHKIKLIDREDVLRKMGSNYVDYKKSSLPEISQNAHKRHRLIESNLNDIT